MPRTKIRFSTLVRDHGPVQRADKLSAKEWQAARERGCYATVYHGESDWGTPLTACVRRDGFVNALCKIAWAKPLPATVTDIIGLSDSQAAWNLVSD